MKYAVIESLDHHGPGRFKVEEVSKLPLACEGNRVVHGVWPELEQAEFLCWRLKAVKSLGHLNAETIQAAYKAVITRTKIQHQYLKYGLPIPSPYLPMKPDKPWIYR